MNAIIERGRKHFNQERFIDVPEWADEDGVATRIFWRPLTIERQRKYAAARAAGQDEDFDSSVRLLIEMAEHGDGTKMFTLKDRAELVSAVDALVLGRIIQAMTTAIPMDDARKN